MCANARQSFQLSFSDETPPSITMGRKGQREDASTGIIDDLIGGLCSLLKHDSFENEATLGDSFIGESISFDDNRYRASRHDRFDSDHPRASKKVHFDHRESRLPNEYEYETREPAITRKGYSRISAENVRRPVKTSTGYSRIMANPVVPKYEPIYEPAYELAYEREYVPKFQAVAPTERTSSRQAVRESHPPPRPKSRPTHVHSTTMKRDSEYYRESLDGEHRESRSSPRYYHDDTMGSSGRRHHSSGRECVCRHCGYVTSSTSSRRKKGMMAFGKR
jgi:hypothetical protein